MSKPWIEWQGGECPVEDGVLVDVRYRDGEEEFSAPAQVVRNNTRRDAAHAFWQNDHYFNDIVAYRLSEGETEKITQQPDSDGWYEHDGKEMPCNADALVEVLLFGETEDDLDATHAGEWSWDWSDMLSVGDIVKWRYAEAAEKPVQETPVKSDGGSSGYYKVTIKNEKGEEFHCETNDVLYAFVGGDFSLGNVIKAARRMYETAQGRGKAGTSIQYDANKVKYFVDDFAKRFGNA